MVCRRRCFVCVVIAGVMQDETDSVAIFREKNRMGMGQGCEKDRKAGNHTNAGEKEGHQKRKYDDPLFLIS